MIFLNEMPHWMTVGNFIISAVSTLTVGGVIGTLIGLRYKRKVEEEKSNQEGAKTDEMNLHNISEVINLYKKALNDFRELKEKDEAIHISRIEQYEKRMAEYEVKLSNYQTDLNDKEVIISDLTKSQLKLKLEMEHLKTSSLEKCETCEFKITCEKYKSKINS